MATHSSTLAWRIPWTEEPRGLQSRGLQRVRHNWATNTSGSVEYALMCFKPWCMFHVWHHSIGKSRPQGHMSRPPSRGWGELLFHNRRLCDIWWYCDKGVKKWQESNWSHRAKIAPNAYKKNQHLPLESCSQEANIFYFFWCLPSPTYLLMSLCL